MWHYFDRIRPFKPGAFKLAVKHKLPIVPIAFNYRRAKGLAKLIHGTRPMLNVNVGEPISPFKENGKLKTTNELLSETRLQIQDLAGFAHLIAQQESQQEAVNF